MKNRGVLQLDKKDIQILIEMRKRIKARSRKCLNKGCVNPAINSHLLQQNGILNHIAENGHVIQFDAGIYHEKTVYRFQKRSIAKAEALTYKGFCSKCDNKIFEPIEKSIPNYEEYITQLLFSYRAFLSEYCEIMDLLETHNQIVENRFLSSTTKALFAPMRRRYSFSAQAYQYYLALLEKELSSNTYRIFRNPFTKKRFKFHTYILPKTDVATSSIFSYTSTIRVSKAEKEFYRPLEDSRLAEAKPLFINSIPKEENTIIILGYAKGVKEVENIPVAKLNSLNENELLKLISDILVKRIDKWCISIPFYEKLKNIGKDKKILELKYLYTIHPSEEKHNFLIDQNLEFNLFL